MTVNNHTNHKEEIKVAKLTVDDIIRIAKEKKDKETLEKELIAAQQKLTISAEELALQEALKNKEQQEKLLAYQKTALIQSIIDKANNPVIPEVKNPVPVKKPILIPVIPESSYKDSEKCPITSKCGVHGTSVMWKYCPKTAHQFVLKKLVNDILAEAVQKRKDKQDEINRLAELAAAIERANMDAELAKKLAEEKAKKDLEDALAAIEKAKKDEIDNIIDSADRAVKIAEEKEAELIKLATDEEIVTIANAELLALDEIKPDIISPIFSSASVNGTKLTIAFTDVHHLDDANLPKVSLFSVPGYTVKDLRVNSAKKTVTLLLTTPVEIGEIITVSYNDKTENNDTLVIQDLVGNDSLSFINKPVENVTGIEEDLDLLDSTKITIEEIVIAENDALKKALSPEEPDIELSDEMKAKIVEIVTAKKEAEAALSPEEKKKKEFDDAVAALEKKVKLDTQNEITKLKLAVTAKEEEVKKSKEDKLKQAKKKKEEDIKKAKKDKEDEIQKIEDEKKAALLAAVPPKGNVEDIAPKTKIIKAGVNIELEAVEYILMKAGIDIDLKAVENIKMHAKKNIVEKADIDMSFTAGGYVDITAGDNISAITTKNIYGNADLNIEYNAGDTIILKAASEILLKVGGVSVSITPGGVSVKGGKLLINGLNVGTHKHPEGEYLDSLAGPVSGNSGKPVN